MQRFISLKPSYSPSLIGVDIQPEEIRLVVLRKQHGQFRIEHLQVINLLAGAMNDGKIMQPEKISAALSEWAHATDNQGNAAAIALPAHCVISKKIPLAPGLQALEQEAEIAAQLTTYFPGTAEPLCFDFAYLKNDLQQDYFLLVAARSERLNQYTDVVSQAGLTVKIVDVDMYALARGMSYALSCEDKIKTMAILNVDFSLAQFEVVHQNEVLVFQQLNQIEEIKLVEEVKRIRQSCLSAHSYLEIEIIYLSGSSPHLVKIAQSIHQKCGIEVELVDPFKHMLFADHLNEEACRHVSPRMLISCGLATRSMP